YPDRLRIEIRERKPFALWQKDGRIALIAVDGVVLENNVRARFADLPRVVGKGAEQSAQDFLALIGRYPAIARVTEPSIFVRNGRGTFASRTAWKFFCLKTKLSRRCKFLSILIATKSCCRETSSRSICDCPIGSPSVSLTSRHSRASRLSRRPRRRRSPSREGEAKHDRAALRRDP